MWASPASIASAGILLVPAVVDADLNRLQFPSSRYWEIQTHPVIVSFDEVFGIIDAEELDKAYPPA